MTDLTERSETATRIAAKAGLQSITFDTGVFTIFGWKKSSALKNNRKKALKVLTVYIEGDGLAWQSRFKRSINPTPVNPMALRLAVKDDRNNVLYLARPCQFEISQTMINCEPKYWTSHRYSQAVIDAYHVIFNALKEQYGIRQFEIIGFSGGGVIAMLLAAQRSDVVQLTTIASNLDHKLWTRYHEVTPLKGSLDIHSFLSKLKDVPQFHLFGSNDLIVPLKINEALLNHLIDNTFVHYRIVEGFDHSCCWVEHWPEIQHNNK